jgi:hypothetical protein
VVVAAALSRVLPALALCVAEHWRATRPPAPTPDVDRGVPESTRIGEMSAMSAMQRFWKGVGFAIGAVFALGIIVLVAALLVLAIVTVVRAI